MYKLSLLCAIVPEGIWGGKFKLKEEPMISLKECFDADLNHCFPVGRKWEIRNKNDECLHTVIARIYLDFDANARFWSIYIDRGTKELQFIKTLFSNPLLSKCDFPGRSSVLGTKHKKPVFPGKISSDTLVFTKRVIIYIDEFIDEEMYRLIKQMGTDRGFNVLVRDKNYALKRCGA